MFVKVVFIEQLTIGIEGYEPGEGEVVINYY